MSAQPSTPERPHRSHLRQATVILPRTGERVKRVITLRDTEFPQDGIFDGTRDSLAKDVDSSSHLRAGLKQAFAFLGSRTCLNMLKCSVAYLLGSLATFVTPVAALLGKNDGKHVVATITVYFHPARSVGSMCEATILALSAFAYAAFVSFSSMAVSAFFGAQDLLPVGHTVVLVVFCGGGLGLVGWLKQRLGNPLVNVACSLTSLAIITVLTKEDAVQDGRFSYTKVVQVMAMVLMGIVLSFLVNVTVGPVWASRQLERNYVDITNAFGDVVSMITRSFLTGREDELRNPIFVAASARAQEALSSLSANLSEAKWEHYVFGTQNQYNIELKLGNCLQRLAQSIGGLRSAAETQFNLLAPPVGDENPLPVKAGDGSPTSRATKTFVSERKVLGGEYSEVASKAEISEDEDLPEEGESTAVNAPSPEDSVRTAASPSEIFALFIDYQGPPMKTLAVTLKQLLKELPFQPGSRHSIAVKTQLRRSLVEAIGLFSEARRKALLRLYKTKELNQHRAVQVAADFEEVAASCGYFSSSLQDFAEEMLTYLSILDDLKAQVEQSDLGSFEWLRTWTRNSHRRERHGDPEEMALMDDTTERGLSQDTPELIRRKPLLALTYEKPTKKAAIAYRVWQSLGFFRRDDIKFAIKVGAGAAFYAMFSFLPETRPLYAHWRGEWGLLSYMLVCSMTIGAANTTGYQRFLGTCIGAALAIMAWIISDANPYFLATLGWVASLGCFYIILAQGKGPMGRFILLTYNLSALYAYSLSVKDDDDDDDEGGIHPEIWEIALHRTVAVLIGCIWGIFVTRIIWPISARQRLKDGLSILWLRMGLIWKRDPLTTLLEGESENAYMNIGEETELNRFLLRLRTLRKAAASEFHLKGPFPGYTFDRILNSSSKMLDAFHAMNVVITKDLKATSGETEILRYTLEERMQLSSRISHLLSVLASSMKIEYPLNDALPDIDHRRDRLLAKIFNFRTSKGDYDSRTEEDFELLYVYALVTRQLAKEISSVGAELEQLYGVLDDDLLKLE